MSKLLKFNHSIETSEHMCQLAFFLSTYSVIRMDHGTLLCVLLQVDQHRSFDRAYNYIGFLRKGHNVTCSGVTGKKSLVTSDCFQIVQTNSVC